LIRSKIVNICTALSTSSTTNTTTSPGSRGYKQRRCWANYPCK